MGAKAITVAAAAFGGIVLIGSGVAGAVDGAIYSAPAEAPAQVEVTGIRSLEADVSGVDVTIRFYDGEAAMLQAEKGSLRRWTLSREGDALKLSTPERWFSWWNPAWDRSGQRATLLLPQSLAGLNADLSLNAGAISASGDFAEIDVDVNAGAVTINGSADALTATVNAGQADIELKDVATATYRVAAGRITSELTGSAPDEVALDASAGDVRLTLPRGAYDLRREVEFGSVKSDLVEKGGSANRITARAEAGTIVLRQG